MVGAGVVIWLERGADLHMAQLMPLPLTVSCFSKIQIGFTFLVPAHPGSPGHRAVKRVCVCVCVCVLPILYTSLESKVIQQDTIITVPEKAIGRVSVCVSVCVLGKKIFERKSDIWEADSSSSKALA